MKKRILVLFLLGLVFFPIASAESIDAEIKEITHYAEDYETGNINYPQLLVYLSKVREDLNAKLGANYQDMKHDAIFRAGELESALGKPTETTKWVWVEKEDREVKLDEEAQVWRKPIFDGNEIQISVNAFPSLLKKKDGTELIFYRLHMDVQFKRSQEELDIEGKIEEIKSIAEEFNGNPTSENQERLAIESINAEQKFRAYMEQAASQCIEVMDDVFGSENRKDDMKKIVHEIEFFDGDNFEAKIRVEYCDDCEWSWISMNPWVERRGLQKKDENEMGDANRERYNDLSIDELKEQLSQTIEDYKEALQSDADTKEIRNKIYGLNWAWDDKANNVWQELDVVFQEKRAGLTPEQMQNYDYQKENEERMALEKEIRDENYKDRKSFYEEELFSSYYKKEFYFEEAQYEKILIHNVVENKQEFCSNKIDDNEDEKVDCADNQCGGQICGQETAEVVGENGENITVTRDLFCIQGACVAREEPLMSNEVVCGNNICEEGEAELCSGDCLACIEHEALSCEGTAIFSGIDVLGCNLIPICIVQTQTCQTNDECKQPLCGTSECIEGLCQTTQITECREAECSVGNVKLQKCADGTELNIKICSEGLWVNTGAICEAPLNEAEGSEDVLEGETMQEKIVGSQCNTISDCGGENDVCSNRLCVTLPQVIEEENVQQNPEEEEEFFDEEREETQEEREQEETESNGGNEEDNNGEPTSNEPSGEEFQPGIIGIVITFLQNTINPENSSGGEPQTSPANGEGGNNNQWEGNPEQGNIGGENQAEGNGRDENNQGENERQTEGQNNIGQDGESLEGSNPGPDGNPQGIHELGAFRVGGSCRKEQERDQGFIYFDGWGEPFGNFHEIKQKYYSQDGTEWCKKDLESLLKQRKEMEKGLNEDFPKWFFEEYLPNSENWGQAISGIHEVYWRLVDLSRQTAERAKCAGMDELLDYNLINLKYESEYGVIELWEEITKNAPVFGEGRERMTVVSPYMILSAFPPKEFIIAEMQKAMKNHEFPGSPEEKLERENEEGLTEEEKAGIREDEEFMEQFNSILDNYGGQVDTTIQLVDYETNAVVFNIFIQMNAEDIIKMTPMLPEEVIEKDIEIKVDFEKVFELIEKGEKESREIRVETPPWDREKRPVQKIKEITNGVGMWLTMRSIISSAQISPSEAESDVRNFAKKVIFKILTDEHDGDRQMQEQEGELGEELGVWEDDAVITGEVLRN